MSNSTDPAPRRHRYAGSLAAAAKWTCSAAVAMGSIARIIEGFAAAWGHLIG